MTTIAAVSMQDAMRATTMQITVTGARRTRIRLWLGTRIMRIAGAVIGCDVVVSVADDIDRDARGDPIVKGIDKATRAEVTVIATRAAQAAYLDAENRRQRLTRREPAGMA